MLAGTLCCSKLLYSFWWAYFCAGWLTVTSQVFDSVLTASSVVPFYFPPLQWVWNKWRALLCFPLSLLTVLSCRLKMSSKRTFPPKGPVWNSTPSVMCEEQSEMLKDIWRVRFLPRNSDLLRSPRTLDSEGQEERGLASERRRAEGGPGELLGSCVHVTCSEGIGCIYNHRVTVLIFAEGRRQLFQWINWSANKHLLNEQNFMPHHRQSLSLLSKVTFSITELIVTFFS